MNTSETPNTINNIEQNPNFYYYVNEHIVTDLQFRNTNICTSNFTIKDLLERNKEKGNLPVEVYCGNNLNLFELRAVPEGRDILTVPAFLNTAILSYEYHIIRNNEYERDENIYGNISPEQDILVIVISASAYDIISRGQAYTENYKYFDGSYRRNRPVAFCNSSSHRGFISVKTMKQHDCINKHCHHCVIDPSHPYFRQQNTKKKKKQQKMEDIARRLKEAAQKSMEADRKAGILN